MTVGRRVASVEEIERPGDYYTDEVNGAGEKIGRSVLFLLPIADPDNPFDHWADPPTDRADWAAKRRNGLHRVAEPPWVFRECADGSLEIRESIAVGRYDPEGEYWHGYLDEGHHWRAC